ncbi:hypothetical protein BURKHO8Y_170428 [Burkholderia sp. 8Y]|nr:hypothetical protein BURKHO8Y_170428 [Burkholderia sp. 8Y]
MECAVAFVHNGANAARPACRRGRGSCLRQSTKKATYGRGANRRVAVAKRAAVFMGQRPRAGRRSRVRQRSTRRSWQLATPAPLTRPQRKAAEPASDPRRRTPQRAEPPNRRRAGPRLADAHLSSPGLPRRSHHSRQLAALNPYCAAGDFTLGVASVLLLVGAAVVALPLVLLGRPEFGARVDMPLSEPVAPGEP